MGALVFLSPLAFSRRAPLAQNTPYEPFCRSDGRPDVGAQTIGGTGTAGQAARAPGSCAGHAARGHVLLVALWVVGKLQRLS